MTTTFKQKALVLDGKVRKDVARLLSLATAKENSRYAINGVELREHDITATDGRQLVTARNCGKLGVEPGIYKIQRNELVKPLEDMGRFPQWENIIPDHEAGYEAVIRRGPSVVLWQDVLQIKLAELGLPVSLTHYVKTFAAMADTGVTWTLQYGEPTRPVMFTATLSGDITVRVVIMPFNLGE